MKYEKSGILLIFFALSAIVFHNLLGAPDDSIIAGSDIILNLAPRHIFISNAVREWHIPWWLPYYAGGVPVVSDPTSMLLYFPLWPLFITGNLSYYGFLSFAQVAFAGFFMFILARRLNMSTAASVMSSVIYAFSGQVLSAAYVGHILHLASFTFYPLIMLFSISILTQKKKSVYAAALALVLAITLFSGHIQYLYYIVLSLTVLYIMQFFASRRQGALGEFARSSLYFAAAAILFVLISLPQIVPTAELATLVAGSQRGSYEFATVGSFHPLLFIRFLSPNLFGDEDNYFFFTYYTENPYLSVFALTALASATLFFIKGRKRMPHLEKVFFIQFLFSIFMMLGKYNPLYYIFFRLVPGISMFREPTRFMIITALSAAMLAGFHLDHLFKKRLPITEIVLKAMMAIQGIILIAFLLLRYKQMELANLLFDRYRTMASGRWLLDIDLCFIYDRINAIFRGNIKHQLFSLIIIGACLIIISACRKRRVSAAAARYLLVCVVFLDLFLMLPHPRFESAGEIYRLNPIEEFLLAQKSETKFRVADIIERGTPPAVGKHFTHANRIDSATWIGQTFAVDYYYNYVSSITPDNVTHDANLDKLEKLNVKYIATDRQINHSSLAMVKQHSGYFLYEFMGFKPRIRLMNGTIEVINYTADEASFIVHARDAGTVFVSEVYYPNWHATIDGREVPVERCEGTFLCFPAGPGDHMARLRYHDTGFVKAIPVSAAAAIFALCLIVLCIILGRRARGNMH
ncbi:MAG: YfhO family protein [archaeon]